MAFSRTVLVSKMARSFLFVTALFLFALVQLGDSLKCYHCVDKLGGECDDPTKNPAFIRDCPNVPGYACITKNTTLVGGGTEIVRDCVPKSQCVTTQGTCVICTTDLCNASSSVLPLLTIIGVNVIITAIISKIL